MMRPRPTVDAFTAPASGRQYAVGSLVIFARTISLESIWRV